MAKVLAPIIVLLMIFAVVDIAVIDRARIRTLPRAVWVAIAIILPVVGPVLWFFVGRLRVGEGTSVSAAAAAPRRLGPIAPDDDPDFLGRLHREQEQEDRIRELEKKLNELRDPRDVDQQED
ncbi:MAG TPA: PLD nuclease N-terminal domain-containing protein [Pseudolysinimonas sp.]|nr:PLD nuclease N-terminal domain-containing protein [Pseudolysinimonas sp.]